MQRQESLKQLVAALGMASALSWSNQGGQTIKGRIWDTNRQLWLSEAELQSLLFAAPAIIVGKRHDHKR